MLKNKHSAPICMGPEQAPTLAANRAAGDQRTLHGHMTVPYGTTGRTILHNFLWGSCSIMVGCAILHENIPGHQMSCNIARNHLWDLLFHESHQLFMQYCTKHFKHFLETFQNISNIFGIFQKTTFRLPVVEQVTISTTGNRKNDNFDYR